MDNNSGTLIVVMGKRKSSPFNFTTVAQPSGSSCGDPQVLASLPYSNTGMTTNGFGDDYNPGDISCNTSYIGGDDYVFEYTPASCEEVSITLSNTGTYTGIFIFAGCPNAGGSCVASDGQSGGNPSLSNITLTGLSAFIDLELKIGYNRIDFMALNQGLVGPNTAQFIVFDDQGKIITAKAWNINKGKTATLGIVRY